MRRSDPVGMAMPRWLTVLVAALPAAGPATTFILLGILGIRVRLFTLSPKDSYLVAGIGLVLAFTLLAMLIVCIALVGALRRALQRTPPAR